MATSTIACKHHWILEPAAQTKPSPFSDGDIDGELYTERYTRGNIAGRCKDCGERRTFQGVINGEPVPHTLPPVWGTPGLKYRLR
jgi:hypothetical protein